jgi:hypothetical protein
MLQNIWELPPPFSVEVSMNTTGLERSALSGNLKSSAVASRQNEQAGSSAGVRRCQRVGSNVSLRSVGSALHKDARSSVKVFFAANMKCAAVFALVILALVSQAFAVLRPLFPAKASPPFSGEVIVIGDDLVRSSAKEAPVTALR